MTIAQSPPAINPQHRGAAIPIYLRGTSKPVGRVAGAWFLKTVTGSKHFLRVPMPALGFDLSTLEDAQRAGAVAVAVTDSETGRTYRLRIETIRKHGFDVTRGFGRQIALPLAGYAIDGRPPEAPPGEPATNKERSEAQLSLFAEGAR